ncbi:protein SCO1 homolog 1, mitochondrial isoform X1 [Capsicum annuum]|uniref:protein SCO1 homolog 1, mitochondrial isoform X1 n=2 Tax=Capsicum annuum TaxID=4072 RepID=UPI001FB13C66|nr:protein SCO1 homolog 1, mitochondrial isoform X1 [Capsicum annuum]
MDSFLTGFSAPQLLLINQILGLVDQQILETSRALVVVVTRPTRESLFGPVSWMSFFLLFCTGAGLVYYYDREKKRHIEGRLLWRPQVCCTNFLKIRRSLDLERDMVEQVGEYVKEFHPNLIGLTGSPEEIKKTARAYRVYYMKTEEEGLDYLVDHSIVMYLMDPKMDFVKYFGKNNDVDMLADGIIMEIKQYKRVKA